MHRFSTDGPVNRSSLFPLKGVSSRSATSAILPHRLRHSWTRSSYLTQTRPILEPCRMQSRNWVRSRSSSFASPADKSADCQLSGDTYRTAEPHPP